MTILAGEIPRRLHEALDQEPFPEARRFKKEAVFVDDNGKPRPLDNTLTSTYVSFREDQAEARRRRIYENQYHRPYPKGSSTNNFWSMAGDSLAADTVPVTVSSPIATAKITTNPLPVVTPSSTSCPTGQVEVSTRDDIWQEDKENLQNDIPPIEVVQTKMKRSPSKRSSQTMLPQDGNFHKETTPPKQPQRSLSQSDCQVEDSSFSCFTPIQLVTPSHATKAENVSPLTLPKTRSDGILATASDSDEDLLYGENGERHCQPPDTPLATCAPLEPFVDLNVTLDTTTWPSMDIETCRPLEFQSFAPDQDVVQLPENNTSKSSSSKSKSDATPQHPHESHQSLRKFLRDTSETLLELHIDDYQESTFDKIVESLYGNSVLETMSIVRSLRTQVGTYRSPSEMECVFEAMKCLPNLKTLLLINCGQDVLPYLATNLPSSLERIHIRVIDGGIPSAVLDSLADKDHLLNVHLEAQESLDLGRLVKSPTLQTLKVCGLGFAVDLSHMQTLGEAFRNNRYSQLMAMDLEPELDLESWQALAEGLYENRSLQHMRISFTGQEDEVQAEEAVRIVAQLLHHNSTLTNLKNRTHDSVHVSPEVAKDVFLEAVHANTNVQELHFFHEDPMIWVTKEALLKRNHHRKQKDTNIFERCSPEGEPLVDHWYESCVDLANSLPGIDVDTWNWCTGGAGMANATTTNHSLSSKPRPSH